MRLPDVVLVGKKPNNPLLCRRKQHHKALAESGILSPQQRQLSRRFIGFKLQEAFHPPNRVADIEMNRHGLGQNAVDLLFDIGFSVIGGEQYVYRLCLAPPHT